MVGYPARDAAKAHFDSLLAEIGPRLALLVHIAEVHGFALDELRMGSAARRRLSLAEAIDLILCERRAGGAARIGAREIADSVQGRRLTDAQSEPAHVRSTLCRYAKEFSWVRTKVARAEDLWEKLADSSPGRTLTANERSQAAAPPRGAHGQSPT